MRRRRLMLVILLFTLTGCTAIGTKEAINDWFDAMYVELILSKVVALILSGISTVTAFLAYTPIGVFQSEGFAYVYGRIAFTGLVLIAAIHAYMGLRVSWGTSRAEEFYSVLSRTVVALIVIRVVPVLFSAFVTATNNFTSIFAADYKDIDVDSILDGMAAKDVELMIVIMSIAFAYYLFRLLMQYSWRIGSLVIAHAFAPILAVAWIIPAQGEAARKLMRNILSLLVVQIAHTVEMWVFTWIAGSSDVEGGIGSLLAQLGILQVMVSTPAGIARLFDWIQSPQRSLSDLIHTLTLTPIRGQFGRIRRAITGVITK